MARETIALANVALNARTAPLNSGILRIYSGVRPATADTALGAQVLLAECTLNATAFGAAANRVATANAVTQDASANAAGNPSFARIFASDGTTALIDVSVGKTGGTQELLVNTTDEDGDPYIAAGSIVAISSLTLTQPDGA